MIFLGIDIGVTGAISAIDSAGTIAIRDLPMTEIAGKRVVKRKVDARALLAIVREFVRPGEVAVALLEDVHAGMGKGSAARSSLDLNRGRIEAVLELSRLQVHAVSPRKWKGYFSLTGKDRADVKPSQAMREAIDTAVRLYPAAAPLLARVKDHNRAEALLIAHYGRSTMA